MDGLFRTLTAIAAAGLLAGCKLAVMVSSGGTVESASRTMDCSGPRYCEFDISDAAFSETFTAVARPGHEFVQWQDGEGFLCAGTTDPNCTVSLPGGEMGEAMVGSLATTSIRPVFRRLGLVDTDGDGLTDDIDPDDDNDTVYDTEDECPLEGPAITNGCPDAPFNEDELVLVHGKRWAQPMQFHRDSWPGTDGVNWNDVAAVCPPPTGLCSGKLMYTDVTGWTWASAQEVSELLNAFMGTSLSGVPDWVRINEEVSPSPNLFNFFVHQVHEEDHWEYLPNRTLFGWVRDDVNVMESYRYGADCAGAHIDSAAECYYLSVGSLGEDAPLLKSETWGGGVWLYRED